MRNAIISLMRVFVALVLGLFMSHTLVLALFKNQIAQKVVVAKEYLSEKAVKLEQQTQAAQRKVNDVIQVMQVQESRAFLDRYNAYLQIQPTAGSPTTPAGTPPSEGNAAATSTPALPVVATPPRSSDPSLAILEDQLLALTTELNTKKTEQKAKLDAAQGVITAIKGELGVAREMLKNERTNANKVTFTFKLPDFQANLGSSTSGKPGVGPKAQIISDFIAKKDAEVVLKEKELASLNAVVVESDPQLKSALATINQKIAERKAAILQSDLDKSDALVKNQKDLLQRADLDAGRVRLELGTRLEALQYSLKLAQSAEKQTKELVSTPGQDPLEATRALIDFLTKGDDSQTSGGSASSSMTRGIAAGFVILTFLSLILIDLTPLMLKLLKAPGGYDDYVLQMRERGVTLPTEDREVENGREPRRGPSVASQQKAAPIPPPPRPV